MATKAKKPAPKKPKAAASAKARKVKQPKYKSFKLSKRIKHPAPKLPSAFKLFKTSVKKLLEHKKLFLGIVAVYLLLTFIFVKGLGNSVDIAGLKASLKEVFSGGTADVVTGVALFSLLLGTTGSTSTDVASTYQTMLLITTSLALIWALRQVYADKKVKVRDSFYKGMYPLVPFMIVLLVIGLQTVPLLLGGFLYGIVLQNGLAITFFERFAWVVLYGLLGLLSIYMISSSIFALYIVTLPDLTPMRALRSARELVRYRRWTVLRKVLFLPLALIIIGGIIMIPLIIYLTFAAEWAFFALTMLALAIMHSYVYLLYRELL